MSTRDDFDKRWPPRQKSSFAQRNRGMDATEFVARYGEIRARVDVPDEKGNHHADGNGNGVKAQASDTSPGRPAMGSGAAD